MVIDLTTTQEVERVLGKTKSEYEMTNAEGEKITQWAYSASGAWPMVYVNFTQDGKYQSHDCDY